MKLSKYILASVMMLSWTSYAETTIKRCSLSKTREQNEKILISISELSDQLVAEAQEIAKWAMQQQGYNELAFQKSFELYKGELEKLVSSDGQTLNWNVLSNLPDSLPPVKDGLTPIEQAAYKAARTFMILYVSMPLVEECEEALSQLNNSL